MVLEDAGYIVREAEHGGAALAQIKEHRPDLVITDVMMPVMGGPELIRRLREDPGYKDVPVIVVSANPEDVVDVNAVLTKPFLPHELLEAARSLLQGEA
jgi:CheY-like chemotaxis protein